MRRAILCPVDFSDASRGALRFAAAISQHFGTRLVVITVDDPLLTEAAAMQSSSRAVHEESVAALKAFVDETIDVRHPSRNLKYVVEVGEPARVISEAVSAHGVELIVMSSHGLTGFRKMFFGSTTERVLRDAAVPVLVTRADVGRYGPSTLEEAAHQIKRVLVPVLLPALNTTPLTVATAIARTLDIPQLLLHVVEPLRVRHPRAEGLIPGIERERRERAESSLDALAASVGAPAPETLIAYGEPSEEIVKVAHDRGIGLVVMGLTGSRASGNRIGSVTYRVLSAAPCPVLALPPVTIRRGKSRTAGKSPRTSRAASTSARGKVSKKR